MTSFWDPGRQGAQLVRAATASHRGMSVGVLVREALERAVDHDDWFIHQVEKFPPNRGGLVEREAHASSSCRLRLHRGLHGPGVHYGHCCARARCERRKPRHRDGGQCATAAAALMAIAATW